MNYQQIKMVYPDAVCTLEGHTLDITIPRLEVEVECKYRSYDYAMTKAQLYDVLNKPFRAGIRIWLLNREPIFEPEKTGLSEDEFKQALHKGGVKLFVGLSSLLAYLGKLKQGHEQGIPTIATAAQLPDGDPLTHYYVGSKRGLNLLGYGLDGLPIYNTGDRG
jgi:hypothetical protein